jgi:hypothetical protein
MLFSFLPLIYLIEIPALFPANSLDVIVPGGFGVRAAGGKAVDGQIAEGGIAQAVNSVQGGGRNADHVAGVDRVFSAVVANFQAAMAAKGVENLLGVVVTVQGWGFAGGEDDDEDFAAGGLGAVHDQIVDVGRKAVTFETVGAEDVVHGWVLVWL